MSSPALIRYVLWNFKSVSWLNDYCWRLTVKFKSLATDIDNHQASLIHDGPNIPSTIGRGHAQSVLISGTTLSLSICDGVFVTKIDSHVPGSNPFYCKI